MTEMTSTPQKLQWKQQIDAGQMKPLVSIDSKNKWYSLLEIGEIWQYRDTLYYLLWRDIKARYKQTILGPFVDIVKPVVSMIVFSLLFGQLAGLPSDGIPYPIFIFTALIPWQLFASALSLATESVYGAKGLLTKVYFPRLLFPINSVLFAVFSQIIPLVILLLMMLFYGIPLSWKIVALPIFALYGLATSLAVSLWLAPITVRYHDIPQFASYLVQFWMFATPVVYSTSIIPQSWQFIYNLNPLTLVVNGWRWALLGVPLQTDYMAYAAIAAVVLLLIGGIIFFKRMEESFADVI
jgi:lipopolysaccharide transport system permease protein